MMTMRSIRSSETALRLARRLVDRHLQPARRGLLLLLQGESGKARGGPGHAPWSYIRIMCAGACRTAIPLLLLSGVKCTTCCECPFRILKLGLTLLRLSIFQPLSCLANGWRPAVDYIEKSSER